MPAPSPQGRPWHDQALGGGPHAQESWGASPKKAAGSRVGRRAAKDAEHPPSPRGPPPPPPFLARPARTVAVPESTRFTEAGPSPREGAGLAGREGPRCPAPLCPPPSDSAWTWPGWQSGMQALSLHEVGPRQGHVPDHGARGTLLVSRDGLWTGAKGSPGLQAEHWCDPMLGTCAGVQGMDRRQGPLLPPPQPPAQEGRWTVHQGGWRALCPQHGLLRFAPDGTQCPAASECPDASLLTATCSCSMRPTDEHRCHLFQEACPGFFPRVSCFPPSPHASQGTIRTLGPFFPGTPGLSLRPPAWVSSFYAWSRPAQHCPGPSQRELQLSGGFEALVPFPCS